MRLKPADQKIYLASKSPRRRELLRQVGVSFELLMLRELGPRGPDVSEAVLPNEAARDYVKRVTRDKVNFAYQSIMTRRLPPHPVLAADTTVVLDEKILGKPADPQEAADMLRALSGKTHLVMTGVAVRNQDDVFETLQVSEVTFAQLSEDTIAAYCATTEPYDKAGGYAVQGMAALFIENIRGSYSGIMGLPLFETAQLLQQAGIKLL